MTLEELTVVIKAQTSGFKKEIASVKTETANFKKEMSSVKTEAESMANRTSTALESISLSSGKASAKMRKEWVSQLQQMIDVVEMKLQILGNDLENSVKTTGGDSKKSIQLGTEVDAWDGYYQQLKKYMKALQEGFVDLPEEYGKLPVGWKEAASMSGRMQSDLGNANDYADFIDQVKELNDQILEAEAAYKRLKRAEGGSFIPIAIESAYQEAFNLNKELAELVQKFMELKGVSKESLANLPGIKGTYAGKFIERTSGFREPEASKIKNQTTTLATALFGIRSIYTLIRKIVTQNEKLTQSITNIFGTIGNILEPIFNLIASLINGISKWFAKIFKVEAGVKKNTDKFLANFDELTKIGNTETTIPSIKEAWNSMSGGEKIATITGSVLLLITVINKLKKLFKSEAFTIVLTKIKTIITSIGEALKKGWEFISPILTKVGAWIASHAALLGGIAVAIAGIVIAIKGVIDYLQDPSWDNFGDTLGGIAVVIAGIALAIGAWPVAVAAAIVAVVSLVARFWEPINSFFEKISNKLQETINNSGLVFGSIVAVVKSVWDAIWNLLEGIVTGIKKIFDGIILIFNGDFKQGLLAAAKGIHNAVCGILNAGIQAINAIVSPIRALIVAIGKVTGKNWTMDNIKIPTIPMLANGGVIDQPTIAMVGEAGREIVTPEKLLTNIINSSNSELASVYAQVGKQIIEAITEKNLEVKIGDETIAKSAARGNNSYYKMTGRNLIGGTI